MYTCLCTHTVFINAYKYVCIPMFIDGMYNLDSSISYNPSSLLFLIFIFEAINQLTVSDDDFKNDNDNDVHVNSSDNIDYCNDNDNNYCGNYFD